jgi:hypothetical protein
LKVRRNSSKDASSGLAVSTRSPSSFMSTFLAWASGFGARSLFLAAKRALRLGTMSPSSATLVMRSLVYESVWLDYKIQSYRSLDLTDIIAREYRDKMQVSFSLMRFHFCSLRSCCI